MGRRLTLRKEALADLRSDELSQVGAAAAMNTPGCYINIWLRERLEELPPTVYCR